jgi:uncharacterized membrane protein
MMTVQIRSTLNNDEPHCYKCYTNAAGNFGVIGHECALLQFHKRNFMKLFLLKFIYHALLHTELAAIMIAVPFVEQPIATIDIIHFTVTQYHSRCMSTMA